MLGILTEADTYDIHIYLCTTQYIKLPKQKGGAGTYGDMGTHGPHQVLTDNYIFHFWSLMQFFINPTQFLNLPTPLVSSYSSVNYLQTSYRTSRRFYVKMADYLAGPSTSFENENVIENQQCAADSKKLCKVCSAPAGKHIYYGARTCISCRGKEFYRSSNVWVLTWGLLHVTYHCTCDFSFK